VKREKFGKPGDSVLRRSNQPNTPRQQPVTWLTICLSAIAVAVSLTLAVGAGLIYRTRFQKKTDPTMVSPTERVVVPTEEAAVAALEHFFESPDPAAMARAVHDGERVRPMMEDYYLRRGHPYPSMSRASKGQPASVGGTQLVFFQVEPFRGPRYPVAVIWEGNRFAVDWESLSAYCTIDWARFIEEKPPTTETIRVYIEAAGTLDKLTVPPPSYTPFRISHRDDPQPITAMANAELSAILVPMTEKRRVPVTLEIQWRPQAQGQVGVPVIRRVVAKGWSD
jgi:hypothetical protein